MKTALEIFLCLMIAATSAAADDSKQENLGQSFVNPLSRFDLRVKHLDLLDGQSAEVLTARLDRPFTLANGWKLNTRLSMTSVISDVAGSDNLAGSWRAGTGDLLAQMFLIAPKIGQTSVGFGARMVFPTAGQDQLGRGKYRIVPVAVMLRFPSWLPAGSFYGVGMRHDISFAGDRRRREIRQLQLVPTLNIALPNRSFLSFFETISHDWNGDKGWFVPLDIEYGRKYAPDRAASLRLQIPLINDLDLYDWALEARLSFFF